MQKYKSISYWYLSIVILTGFIVIIGGITRLTSSGLSITQWKPITGSIPPLNEQDWISEFNEYKKYPEYQKKNPDMSLKQFQSIYFWEFLHRMMARIIGIVFLLPFVYFLTTNKLKKKQIYQSIFLFILGSSQGFVGWFMVQSGLVDRPDVSHYRLAIHLLLAFCIGGYAFYLFCRNHQIYKTKRNIDIKIFLIIFAILCFVQFIFGAFVAGLDAGKIYNTWPTMAGKLIPANLFANESIFMNFLENKITIQFVHRKLAIVIFLMSLAFLLHALYHKWTIRDSLPLLLIFTIVLVQFVLGVLTLLWAVPIVLGVLHQFVAFCLTLALVYMFYFYMVEIHS